MSGRSRASSPIKGTDVSLCQSPEEYCALMPDCISSSDDYASRFDGPVGSWMLDVQIRTILELLPDGRSLTILDVGGGHAQLAPSLHASGHDVTIAMSPGADQSRVRRAMGNEVALHVGPVEQLSLPDRSFDVVVSVRMMAHVSNPDAYLRDLCRIAKLAVIVDFPARHGANMLGGLLFFLKKMIERDTRRYVSMNVGTVIEILQGAGFVADASTGLFLFPMVLHRLLRACPRSPT